MSTKMKLLYTGARLYWRIFRPITIAVCVLLIKNGREVLLVEHTYRPGWHLPGGGIKKRETLMQAARREAQEEVGATLGAIQLFGTYSNFAHYKSDHVVLYLCEDFELAGSGQSDAEIARFAFFALDDLPPDVSDTHRGQIETYQRQG